MRLLSVVLFLVAAFFESIGQSTDMLPVVLDRKGDSLILRYEGQPVFRGKIHSTGSGFYLNERKSVGPGGQSEFTIAIGSYNFKSLTLSGRIAASEEAFACESEPRDGLKVVRHVVGQSYSLRNNAVYDRKRDWLLSVDNFYPTTVITPAPSASSYDISIKGWELIVRFRPSYYKKHRGLAFFEPAQYKIWDKPVVGWCSWYAYLDKIDEQKIKHTTDVVAEKLKPFGLEYIQMDDGYQQLPIGMPQTWQTANAKFPSGLPHLAQYISSRGLKPAIWTNVSFADSAAAHKNKNLFVLDNKGNPARGNWIGYPMDGSNPETIKQLITPVYKNFSETGWVYFKLDALRHLRYEGYNTFSDYFASKKKNRVEAFRNVVKAVRDAVGRENFLMGCWGIRPELAGIIDACRVGNDGYSYAGLAQFNSYNNVVWLNDPDHIELSEKEAYRSCVATSLTGSLFMVTDKPEIYDLPVMEAAKRSIPILPTRPGQVYDVDPSRSSLIANADIELSGSGPRSFDASTTTTTGLFSLELNTSFENWLVLGRLDDRDKKIQMKDLGLDDSKEYLVFEFWSKQLTGIFTSSFDPGVIEPKYNCQVFVIREKQSVPQLISSNRHISGGALEVRNLKWAEGSLKGESATIENDAYTLYIYEPRDFKLKNVAAQGAEVVENVKSGSVRKVTLQTAGSKTITWSLVY